MSRGSISVEVKKPTGGLWAGEVLRGIYRVAVISQVDLSSVKECQKVWRMVPGSQGVPSGEDQELEVVLKE